MGALLAGRSEWLYVKVEDYRIRRSSMKQAGHPRIHAREVAAMRPRQNLTFLLTSFSRRFMA